MQTTPAPDALMLCYYELANMQNIDDIKDYAMAWKELGSMFEADGRPAMADACYGRSLQYRPEPAGEYIRIIELPFSELIPVAAMSADEFDYILKG